MDLCLYNVYDILLYCDLLCRRRLTLLYKDCWTFLFPGFLEIFLHWYMYKDIGGNIVKLFKHCCIWGIDNYRLIHGHFHIGLVIIQRPPYWPETQSMANMGRGMITRPIWKCPCIKLFITLWHAIVSIQ